MNTAVVLGMAAGRGLRAQAAPLRIETTRLADNLLVISGYTNGNILAIIADTGVVLIDAQSARRVPQADSALRTVTMRPVRLVINTHYHEDHTSGNAYYRSRGAAILAHRNVPIQEARDTTIAEWKDWHRTPAVPDARPTRVFDDTLTVRFGDEEIRVMHAPLAHTDGDAIIWLRRANVVHVGDILERGAPPFIDWWVGGTLDGMIAAVDYVLAHMDARTRVVPGHGDVTDREGLRDYRDMLATIGARVKSSMAAGRTLEEAVAAHPAAEYVARFGSASRADEFIALLYIGMRRVSR
jgi:glyoxylase-like metal-dependent hydrolase (beta-lactamase superfamily II)